MNTEQIELAAQLWAARLVIQHDIKISDVPPGLPDDDLARIEGKLDKISESLAKLPHHVRTFADVIDYVKKQ